MPKTKLETSKLTKNFKTTRGVVHAVADVDLVVREGETLGLVGESGSGKSTVAYMVVGIYAPTSGTIFLDNQDIAIPLKKRSRSLKKEIQIVFQDPGSSLNPRRTIEEILAVPLGIHKRVSRRDLSNEIVELLETVGLPENYMYKYPQEIGGGEKQIVAIARALATEPSLVALDEPTSALDVSVQGKIIRTLLDLQGRFDLTYLFITHDLSVMRNVATRVAIMYLGRLCEIAPAGEFFREPFHPYTKMLLSAIPVISEAEAALKPDKIIPKGEIPSPIDLPSGCSFHLRCPHRMPKCSKIDPAMTQLGPEHSVRCHLSQDSL